MSEWVLQQETCQQWQEGGENGAYFSSRLPSDCQLLPGSQACKIDTSRRRTPWQRLRCGDAWSPVLSRADSKMHICSMCQWAVHRLLRLSGALTVAHEQLYPLESTFAKWSRACRGRMGDCKISRCQDLARGMVFVAALPWIKPTPEIFSLGYLAVTYETVTVSRPNDHMMKTLP